ncbi:MAG: DUF4381 family protein [Paramuribaculum sp.]|nr:DUF4381 family protein [Paramuribaculum sp.]
MKCRFLYIVSLLIVVLASTNRIDAAPAKYTATAVLDSTLLIQGGKALLSVEFSGQLDANAHTEYIDTMWHNVEIKPIEGSINTYDGTDRATLRSLYVIQAFDSGLYTLPPIYCISGSDTVLTNQPVLKVEPMPLDTANLVMENGEVVDLVINDFTDVADADYSIFDVLPGWATDYGWWILGAIIIIALLAFVYFKWLRHGKIPLMPVHKPVPPYELAKQSLEALRAEGLWQKGAEKEYYTKLTDILRTYIQGRFGINAMEMTSREIYEALAANDEAKKVRVLAQDLMREADFVKFAQNRPGADENEEAFRLADTFVESTKPVPVEPGESDDKPASATNQEKEVQS